MDYGNARRMNKAVRATMMAMLKERVADPTKRWGPRYELTDIELVAGDILAGAKLIDNDGKIALTGMDYYRRETANPILTWILANWFAVIVAGCTIGVSIFGIVSG